MAEHAYDGPVELGAEMDYAEHERTYDGFLILTKVSIVVTINILLALALFAFGGGWGFWWGMLILLAGLVAGVIGIASGGSIRGSVVIAVLGLLLVAMTAG